MSPSHPQIKTPLRFCLSCAVTLACWVLWLILAAALGIQIYIASIREIAVPDFLLRRIEQKLAASNLGVEFGRARLNPTGQLLFEDVRLRSLSFEDPLLRARFVYARRSLWSVLAGRPLPDELVIEGATLQLPAMLSPSGASEPLLSDFAATLRYDGDIWQVEQITGTIASLRLTAHGEFTPPHRPGPKLSLDELISRYLRGARTGVLQLPRLQTLDHPALDVQFRVHATGDLDLIWRVHADGVHQPAGLPLELGPLAISGRWSWQNASARPLFFHAELDSLDYADRVHATQLRLRGELQLAPDLSAARKLHLQLATGSIAALGEHIDYPQIDYTLTVADGRHHAEAAFGTTGEVLTVTAQADLPARTAQFAFDGRVPPALVTSVLSRYGPKLEPYFRFGDPVAVHGTARLAPGWRFDGIHGRARIGRLDSHGVPVTSARGRIDVDAAGNFLATDAYVTLGVNYARGSYAMNFFNHDYRMLLTGQLRPPEIAGWFRDRWWLDFWKSFSFPTAPPDADVEVSGNWQNPTRTLYYGRANATDANVLGIDLARAHTLIFLRPQFTHALALTAERAAGTQHLTGWFKRYADPASRRTTAWEYDARGNFDPSVFPRAAGKVAADLVAPWRFPRPPQLHVWGRTDLPAAPAAPVNKLRFELQSEGSLHYYDFPAEQLSLTGTLNDRDLRVDRIDFRAAGGTGHAQATLGGPPEARQLGFDATLKEADLVRAIRSMEEFQATRTGTKAADITNSKFIKRASGGKLDVAISAQADPANLDSLHGHGNVQITGAELGEIHLFGLLSQLLSALWLNFSSLKLDSARSSFTLNDGRVHFPDVKITGPSAAIDAKGDYLIAQKSLDFTARLKPYEESRNPITLVVGLVINPLTSIFELKLTGPIAKPTWSLFGGGNKNPAPTTPAPTASTPSSPDAKTTPAPAKSQP